MIRILNHLDPAVAGKINEIQQASYQVESWLIEYPRIPYMLEEPNDILTSRQTFVGFLKGDDLTGVISYELEDEHTLVICRLVVAPAYFRQGIAFKLVKKLEHLEPGIRQMYVRTAFKNLPAIELYKKAGFYPDIELNTPDGLKIIRMKRTLDG
jgi:ribosomal protein S18 acetylase RimI-like enzyme